MKKQLTIIWVLLIVLTIISALISTTLSENNYLIEFIIGLAVLKFIGVTFYFMELKEGHVFWKAAIISFLVVFSIIIFMI